MVFFIKCASGPGCWVRQWDTLFHDTPCVAVHVNDIKKIEETQLLDWVTEDCRSRMLKVKARIQDYPNEIYYTPPE